MQEKYIDGKDGAERILTFHKAGNESIYKVMDACMKKCWYTVDSRIYQCNYASMNKTNALE